MSLTTWLDARVAAAVKVAVDEASKDILTAMDTKLANLEANVGAMFTTVSKDIETVADGLSKDVTDVSNAVDKNATTVINAIGAAIANVPQQIVGMLPKFPGF